MYVYTHSPAVGQRLFAATADPHIQQPVAVNRETHKQRESEREGDREQSVMPSNSSYNTKPSYPIKPFSPEPVRESRERGVQVRNEWREGGRGGRGRDASRVVGNLHPESEGERERERRSGRETGLVGGDGEWGRGGGQIGETRKIKEEEKAVERQRDVVGMERNVEMRREMEGVEDYATSRVEGRLWGAEWKAQEKERQRKRVDEEREREREEERRVREKERGRESEDGKRALEKERGGGRGDEGMVEARRQEEVNLRAEDDTMREEEGILKLAQQVCRELDHTWSIMPQNESDFGV